MCRSCLRQMQVLTRWEWHTPLMKIHGEVGLAFTFRVPIVLKATGIADIRRTAPIHMFRRWSLGPGSRCPMMVLWFIGISTGTKCVEPGYRLLAYRAQH